jgi:hypothetical protein
MTTQRIFTYLLIVPMMFLLTACPYTADIPLDKPTQKINTAMLGKWAESSTTENPSFFVISEINKETYKFEQNDYESEEKKYKQKNYIGYFIKIGETNFLNLKGEDNKYLFFKLEASTDKTSFKLYEVTDNIDETFSDSTALKAFFTKNKDLSFFYNKDEKTYLKK